MKFFDYKNELGLGILVSTIIVVLMSAIMIPAFLLSNNKVPSTSQMASVVFNSYKVSGDEKTSITESSEFSFMAEEESSESFTNDITATIDSASHVLVTYEVQNKSQDKTLDCVIDTSKLTITNCKVSYSTNGRTFTEMTESTQLIALLPADIKVISVKIEIVDSALNSLLSGGLSLILSLS